MQNNHNIHVGDIVYSEMPWSFNIIKVRVTAILPQGVQFDCLCSVNEAGEEIFKEYGSAGAKWDNVYLTAADAYKSIREKAKEQTQIYCDEIKTVEDLAKFPLEHCINGGEYADYDAIKAYKLRTKELLGFDLDAELLSSRS